MSAESLQQVLDAVRRHRKRTRLVGAARQAAWGSALVMLGGLLIHLFVRPLTFGGLGAAALVPWLLAFVQSVIARARPVDCAAWADQHLDGRSAYATALEQATDVSGARSPAQAHLEEWIAGTAAHSRALLATQPRELRLRQPIVTALVCAALAAGLLQLPTRPLAGGTAAVGPEPTSIVAATTALPETVDDRPTHAPAATVQADLRQATTAQDRNTASPAQATASAANQETQGAAATRDNAAIGTPGTATSSPSTGRDAGSSRDAGTDATPSSAWTDALAARLRAVTSATEPESAVADATRPVEYLAADAASERSTDGKGFVAAATPPPARDVLRVGPAERAYLRAYWAANGARP